MNITMDKNGNSLKVALEGRLDTTTSPELESKLEGELNEIADLVFDFEKLEYLSSAGLRVLLAAQKIMNKQGKMVIRNANNTIKEIFEVTGFSNILVVE